MLLNLHIKNIALIDEINIDFSDNLNILTGETGAGKSIILGSVNIALGGKFLKDIIRDDKKEALVELLFSIDNESTVDSLKEIGIDVSEDNEVLVSRKLSNGRVINKINDDTVTVTKLKEVAHILIDIHGQHDNQSLLSRKNHIKILDRFGKKDIESILVKVNKSYKTYKSIQDEIVSNKIDEEEKIKKIDFLKFEINEIEKANLVAGEDDVLYTKYKKINNAKNIISAVSSAYDDTNGDNSSASIKIANAYKYINQVVEYDSDLQEILSILLDVDGLLNDFNMRLSQYLSDLSFDDEEFYKVSERLDYVNEIKSKYGRTIEDVLAYKDKSLEELEKYNNYQEYIKELNKKLIESEKELKINSELLSNTRKHIASKLVTKIKEALKELNFLDVRFDMIFEKLEAYSENGIDNPYLVIATNVGEDIKALEDIASGGELSRIMLAIKSSMANEDDIDTLIFDEIDAGISGKTAGKVAEKLDIIGRTRQVICITHLPQIAAIADANYSIEKNVKDNKTITTIKSLDEEKVIKELARLIGGDNITHSVITSAKEMREMTKNIKTQ